MQRFDVIVLGLGGVGSAAAFHLAGRGARVLGIEQFTIAHDRGSSHGQTRMIRQAYFEHPDYVPLVERAFELWRKLESEAGETLYRQVGLVEIGPPDGEVIQGVRTSARQHALSVEDLSAAEARRRFPGLRVPVDCEAVFETRAGYLLVEQCVAAHARGAQRRGAASTPAKRCAAGAEGSGVLVETDRDRYQAERLIVTAGAWAGELLADLGIPLEVRRKPLYWFRTTSDVYRADHGCPAFLYDLPQGCYYSLPQIDDVGLKVAEHSGGRVVSDPTHVDRDVDADDLARVADFVRAYLPDATTDCVDHAVCMYTMTPDGHFVVDLHPACPQVAFAAGLSGHGFKFTGVLGEALAELALCGTAHASLRFLAADRETLGRV